MGQANSMGGGRSSPTMMTRKRKQELRQAQTQTLSSNEQKPLFQKRSELYMYNRSVSWLSIPTKGDPILSDYKNLNYDEDSKVDFYLGETSSLITKMSSNTSSVDSFMST